MRGALRVGESDGGPPPDRLTEDENEILEGCIRVVEAHGDAEAGAVARIGIAPCSPFSVSRARAAGIRYGPSIPRAEVAPSQVLDRPLQGRMLFEEELREDLDPGTPTMSS